MRISEDIHSTQQLANAAETFVNALGALFPRGTFDQFFHGSTLRRAYWSALQMALDGYATPENAPLTKGLMNGQVLADEGVVSELLKLFLPGEPPDYSVIARRWAVALSMSPDDHDLLTREAELLFGLLASELRRSADLRLALDQLAQMRYSASLGEAASTPEEDLTRLLDAELVAGPGTLGLQVRHVLALAALREPVPAAPAENGLLALAALADYLPPRALRQMRAALDRLGDLELRLRVLGRIAPYLSRIEPSDPLTLVQQVMDRGGTPLDPALRVEVLLDLAPHLDAPDQDRALPSFQQRLLEGAQAIGDPASRVRALGALIENLPPELQSEALSMAFDVASCCIENDVARAAALSVLPPHLPLEFHSQLLGIAYGLETPDARALLLGRMIPYLMPPVQTQALIGALNAIEQINGDDARTAALIALAPYIDSVGPLQYVPEGLQQAITVTFSIEGADDRARAFAALAPYLSPELLTEALQVLKGIADDYDRAVTLTRLAPHLPADLAVAAFAIAQELQPAEARATALAAVAPYLSPTARAQALADALASALAIERRYERVVALADLAPQLADDLHWRALQEALTATRSIPDESERGRALVFLAPHLLEEQLADALADAYTIFDPLERVPALSALVPRLPPGPCMRVAQDVINLAQALKPPHQKASILASVAPVLPAELVDKAMAVVLQIDAPYDRMHVLAALLPRLPEKLHDVALSAAHAVPDRYQRVSALLELVPHTSAVLRYPILEQALETALGIQDDYDRASALAHLAPYIGMQSDIQNRQQDALSLALDACLEVSDPGERAALLEAVASIWVQLLTPAQSYTLWRRVIAFVRERSRAEALFDLAALALVIDYMSAPGALGEIVGGLVGLTFGEK
jgi:hypothetical protein